VDLSLSLPLLRSLGLAELLSSLERECEVAGGVALLTREHLADVGVPRAMRAPLLRGLADLGDAGAHRRELAERIPLLQSHLGATLRLALDATSPSERLSQSLFAFAAVLRHVACALLSPHLKSPTGALAPALELLERPSNGQLWAAARLLAKFAPTPETAALAEAVRQLDGMEAPKVLGPGRLVDKLLAQRNALAHGAAILDESESRVREVAVVEGLRRMVDALDLSATPDASLCSEAADGELGLLEGWDATRRRLHFTGSTRSWDIADRERWERWAAILHRVGVLGVGVTELDASTLARRAEALTQPAFSRALGLLPAVCSLMEAQEPGRCDCRDPWFAAAVLANVLAEPVLVCDGRTMPVDALPAVELSRLLGLSPGIESDDPTPPGLEALRALSVIVVSPPLPVIEAWERFTADLGGPRCWYLAQSDREDSIPGLGHLAEVVYDAARRLQRDAPSWEELPADVRASMRTYRRLWSIALRPELRVVQGGAPLHLDMLRDALRELPPGRCAEALVRLLVDRRARIEEELAEALLLHDVVSPGLDGSWSFGAPEWESAAQLFAIRHGTHRVLRTLLLRLGPSDSLDDARARDHELRARQGLVLPSPLLVERLAVKACAKRALDLGAAPLDQVFGAARALSTWGLPLEAGRLLQSAAALWDGTQREQLAFDARRFAPVDVAIQLLESCANADGASPQALHQLAGALRDRAATGDRARAEQLYVRVLALEPSSAEQRVRTLCGRAENLGKDGNIDEALKILCAARELASSDGSVALVEHRLAWLHLERGDASSALVHSNAALARLPATGTGELAQRALDTHARVLLKLDRGIEALAPAEESVRLKRRRGDRRGLQMGLQLLSALRQRADRGDAVEPALEALRLAERAGDVVGRGVLHRRLRNLLRVADPEKSRWHEARATELAEGGPR
jgi:tetratricopeptide (TPR) repeat protein